MVIIWVHQEVAIWWGMEHQLTMFVQKGKEWVVSKVVHLLSVLQFNGRVLIGTYIDEIMSIFLHLNVAAIIIVP